MTATSSRIADRIAGRRGAKFASRRADLAVAATRALAGLGYADAGMRDIAHYCGTSLGVLHYYFENKADLVLCCVRQYKAEFVDRYSAIIIEGASGAEVKQRICTALEQTLREHGAMHRLWYDLRNQSLFDSRYAEHVREIDASLATLTWRAVTTYAALTGKSVTVGPAVVYATADGLFRRALWMLFDGDDTAPHWLSEEIGNALDYFVAPRSTGRLGAEGIEPATAGG